MKSFSSATIVVAAALCATQNGGTSKTAFAFSTTATQSRQLNFGVRQRTPNGISSTSALHVSVSTPVSGARSIDENNSFDGGAFPFSELISRAAQSPRGKTTAKSTLNQRQQQMKNKITKSNIDDSKSSSTTTSKQKQLRRRKKVSRRMMRPKSLNSSSSKIEGSPKSKKNFPELLTREEEIQLTNSLRMLRTVVRLRDDLAMTGLVEADDVIEVDEYRPTEAEWAAACGLSVLQLRRIMFEGQEARTKLVAANGGLVHSIAKKHYYTVKRATEAGGGVGTILTLQDMIQEGNLGLMEAAERFEPERGFRFSTYATWWVRQRILRSISDYSRVIRLPAHVHTMVKKINKTRKEMEEQIGREPSAPELAHELEMTVEKLQLYSDSARNVVSLELPVSNGSFKGEDRRTIGDRIASDSPTPEEDAELDSLRQDIRTVIGGLADRERDVLVERFGLEDGTARTVEETSKRLGISRDRVRMVEARALNKLRHPQRNYKLKEYVGGDAVDPLEEPEVNLSPERIWSF
mmetsp:Transcript_17433/g.24485  ORF Transcript_17433/g.24485 Transcript_17433/m.24485 type:complete len:522 (+) Transcript_17433:98-1663(+)